MTFERGENQRGEKRMERQTKEHAQTVHDAITMSDKQRETRRMEKKRRHMGTETAGECTSSDQLGPQLASSWRQMSKKRENMNEEYRMRGGDLEKAISATFLLPSSAQGPL